MPANIELNTVSYILLTTIFSAASVIAIKHGKQADAHPLVMISQAEFSPLRYPRESAIIKSKLFPGGAPILNTSERGSITTLSDMYQIALLKRKSIWLGKQWKVDLHSRTIWVIFLLTMENDSMDTAQSIFSGLIKVAKLTPSSEKETSFVGIYASTSPDSYMTEIACHWGGLVTIPIAAQATSSHLLYVLRNTSLSVLVIDETHLEFVLQLIEGTAVKHIVAIRDTIEEDNFVERSKYFGVTIHSLNQIKKLGQQEPVERSIEIAFDSIASIYYSSNPKNNIILSTDQDDQRSLGVILTHKNILSAISSYLVHVPLNHKIVSKDILMHSFAIDNVLGYILQAMTTFVGGSIAFEDKIQFNDFNLDMESVLATIKEFKPTIYASGAPFLKQAQKLIANKYGTSFIFQRGLDRKDRYHREGRLVSDCVYDMFLFRQIRMSMFGGQIHTLFMDDDDSPTNKVDLASFYRAVLGAQVIKTFSRPETTSGMTATMIYDYTADKRIVGPPLAAMEIKLSDHKEYTAEDNPNPRGEVKVRGNNVFAGYWDDTERTRMDLVDPDGWFSTGMIGELLPNGSFMLLGPKKHL